MTAVVVADTARDQFAYVVPALAVLHRAKELRQEWNPCAELLPWESLTEAQKSPWIGRAWAQREGWRPPALVITGDVATVTAALDALPAGTVIRIVEEEDGPQVFEAVVAHGHYAPPIVWSSTRSPRLVDSGYIARGETPVTVPWAGETA